MNLPALILLLLHAALTTASPILSSPTAYESAKALLEEGLSLTTPHQNNTHPLTPRQASPIPGLPAPSRSWTCYRGGDSSHGVLQAMHIVFNTLFGAPRLSAGPNQCHVAVCGAFHLSWCNLGVEAGDEDAGARDMAVAQDPGKGTMCMAAVEGPGFDPYKFYYWGRVDAVWTPWYGGGSTVKTC
ncbi:hypothetical protein CGMCC3_g5861 [Colletotrichum fructicola]|uniref:Uncharacterized protein n=2 Tax=Colletotrichum fructicola (strain Nara gc5) TaxID=1213859 RepID=A0A7J6JHI4_COLFN|nr:uncharacterized protein CGMCC3_g5861 [Colletotrichum fructicola]KAF4489129.1 hypothetical protein CGGC5_v004114 [Colletotrichum fructicola Nara gc5]KAI8289746.1 hypothetical protein K4K60_007992 [Colletotrichum sp. SAR11_57]KAE9578241.1 hypothetical protein CGMCC3_g5861 [Colletotrichum fructicola]KAF4425657.1 hypothetical protein CFRS1_v000374 [Colletotrichum fructicola]KAF5503960.1 hypothetical protein CGCF413_v004671 [Colletotrichum fructicola]